MISQALTFGKNPKPQSFPLIKEDDEKEKVIEQKRLIIFSHSEPENIVPFWRNETVEICIGDLFLI